MTIKREYLRFDENKNLIGKRAKFKDSLSDYSIHILGKTGVIMHHEGSDWISLKFDEPYKYGYENCMIMKTCFIKEGSILILKSGESSNG